MSDGSKVIKASAYRWQGVPVTAYKESGALFRDVTRQTLLGEGAGEDSLRFLTRYFEVQPGGWSTLERHEHPHTVVVLRGRGSVVLGDVTHDIAPYDAVYIAPAAVHQFRATTDEPLGFLCIVDRVRDRAVPVSR
jgi:mannose-6-phosphate isomerase-like protein (cupin superfamily)